MRGDIKTLTERFPEIIKESEYFFEGGLTRDILRLLPYLHYLSMNDMRIDTGKIKLEETDIIEQLYINGHLIEDKEKNTVQFTKDFWNFTSNVLYYSYTKIGRMEI